MNFLKKIRNENNMPIILFLILLINFFPLFKGNLVHFTSYAVTVKEMTICFALELILLCICFFKKVKIDRSTIINMAFLGITTVILFIIQLMNFKSGDYEKLDFINIACIFLNILMLYIVFLNFKIEEKNIYYFFVGIVALGWISCIVNFAIYYKDILSNLKNPTYIVIKSFFAHKNQFAEFLYISIISDFFLLFNYKNKHIKSFLIVSLCLFGINILLTMSRTSILVTLIFFALFFITTDSIKSKHKLFIICALLISMVCIVVVLKIGFPEILEKIINAIEIQLIRKESLKNFSERDIIWEVAFSKLSESNINILFGIGRFKSIGYIRFLNNITQFHNFYIDIIMTGGIMELCYFIGIYGAVVKRIIKSQINKNYKKMYIAMYISFAVYSMFESLGRFSIGCADTLCLIFFISIPLLHSNTYVKETIEDERKEISSEDKK